MLASLPKEAFVSWPYPFTCDISIRVLPARLFLKYYQLTGKHNLSFYRYVKYQDWDPSLCHLLTDHAIRVSNF